MKKTTILIGVIATAVVLSIAFRGVALASQPVCPAPETETIKTVTQISCQGMVTETEKVSWESSNEDLINNPPLAGDEIVGKMDYYQDMKVTDGVTTFIKDMDVDTGSVPNLNVMKSIGYTQGTTIGSLSHDEEVSMGLVSNYTAVSGVVLCPFTVRAVGGGNGGNGGNGNVHCLLPASCEYINAKSDMVVTEVLATTITRVTMSESPVSLHYAITATGSGGAGTKAHGNIAAEFSVYIEDGSAETETNTHCGIGDPASHTLGSKLTHYEKSTANGLWEFSKEMDYTSTIRP